MGRRWETSLSLMFHLNYDQNRAEMDNIFVFFQKKIKFAQSEVQTLDLLVFCLFSKTSIARPQRPLKSFVIY